MTTTRNGTRLAWIAGQHLDIEVINRAVSELINNVIIVGAEPTGCEAFVAALLSNQITEPLCNRIVGDTTCTMKLGHDGYCIGKGGVTESLSDQVACIEGWLTPPRRVEDTLCDEDFTIECNVTGSPYSRVAEQLADRISSRIVEKREEDNVCIAADMASDDGYCGAPEFCDCARFAAQREDRQGFAASPGYTVEEKEAPSWMRVLTLVPGTGRTFDVFFKDNNVFLGDIIQKEDGYYDFWPADHNGGYWAAYVLRAIADVVDELNEPWDQQIQNDPALNHP